MTELKDLKGIGNKRITALNNAGFFNCSQLLNFFPYKYYDFSSIDKFDEKSSTELTIKAVCVDQPKNTFLRGMSWTTVKFKDELSSNYFTAIWYNQPFMKNAIKVDEKYYLLGKNNKKKFVITKYFKTSNLSSNIIPIYKNIPDFPQKLIGDIISQICDQYKYESFLDNEDVLSNFISIKDAYKNIHFPISIEGIEESKKRIQLEDMLMFASLNEIIDNQTKTKERIYEGNIEDFNAICPYNLTNSQSVAIAEIFKDMKNKNCMNRILLGDVGSGKTLVAFAAAFLAMQNKYQTILLAPTSILAAQHYNNAIQFFNNNFNIEILSSSKTKKEIEDIYCRCQKGKIDLLIATHSALNENLKFNNLALVIDDEQHRFGVDQRSILSKKGVNTDMLHLSATPIPRTLSLVLFGNVSLSKLTERPLGDSVVKTNILTSKKLPEMWQFIEDKIRNQNSKCFVIVPRVTENDSEDDEIMSIDKLNNYLKNNFNLGEIGVVFGRQDKDEQEKIISKFKDGDINLLIATTVVEVGIDIPDANIMVVYNADRFGLATLHQLRGRIGRRGQEGNCFVVSDSNNSLSMKRLKIFKEFNDGEQIATEDLKLRGSGTIYGTKQHGYNEIFSEITFNLSDFDSAKTIYSSLSEFSKNNIRESATNRYQTIIKKIILN